MYINLKTCVAQPSAFERRLKEQTGRAEGRDTREGERVTGQCHEFVYVGALIKSCFLLGVEVKTLKDQVMSENPGGKVVERNEAEVWCERVAGLDIGLTGRIVN